MTTSITCDNLDEAIELYQEKGYRLDMIFPADKPREALLEKNGEELRLFYGAKSPKTESIRLRPCDPLVNDDSEWTIGRAGMLYRDLIPDRLDGRVIASHIRLTWGGDVPDYVHYHKVDFQMIYCRKGLIKVVYEDQGEPFWLGAGDCVLQPPEIRHRVLECTAGAEVIEISMPAEHETWVEHDIELPTSKVLADRDFNGQRFVRHVAANAEWKADDLTGLKTRDLGISEATSDKVHAYVARLVSAYQLPTAYESNRIFRFFFYLGDDETLAVRIMK